MKIQLTRDEALMYGLLTCKHCGLPPNNHFGNGKPGGSCAHRKDCPGYEEISRVGRIVE